MDSMGPLVARRCEFDQFTVLILVLALGARDYYTLFLLPIG